MEFHSDQIAQMTNANIRDVAPQYAAKLRAENIPIEDFWTEADLIRDTEQQIAEVMQRYDLHDPADVYQYLALRHRVGPSLYKLTRVSQHLRSDDSPPGSRILSLLAAFPASYWIKIRGQAGFESADS
ncbi:MAG: hypothetical protein AAGH68_04355 [Pseudomonadota bacterium]